MTYVPIVTPVHVEQPPSPQTRELADLLGRVVQEYEKAHPTITGPEVSEALQLAKRASSKAVDGQKAAMAVAMVLGVVVMVAGIVVYLAAGGSSFTIRDGGVLIAVLALGIAGAFVAILRRSE